MGWLKSLKLFDYISFVLDQICEVSIDLNFSQFALLNFLLFNEWADF